MSNSGYPRHTILLSMLQVVRRFRIFTRLTAAFLLLTVVPCLVIGYIAYVKNADEVEEAITNYIHLYLDGLNRDITEKLKEYEALSYQLSSNERFMNSLVVCENIAFARSSNTEIDEEYRRNKKIINDFLFYAVKPLDQIMSIIILTPAEEYTQVNTEGEKIGGRVANIETYRASSHYSNAMERIGYPVWEDTTSESRVYTNLNREGFYLNDYITMTRAIINPETKKVLGIMIINISTKAIIDLYSQDVYVNNGNLLLLQGSRIKASLNENPTSLLFNRDVFHETALSTKGTRYEMIGGMKNLIMYRNLDPSNWSIAFVVPAASILQSIDEIRNTTFAAILVCICVSFVISYIVTSSISKPLKMLKNTISNINEENMDTRYADPVNDEISKIGYRFNDMMDRVSLLIQNIYIMENEKRDEMHKRQQAELDALQMQINPHFIYNTLDMIRWEAFHLEQKNGKLTRMIKAFADLLRLGTKKSAVLVPLQEEIDHVATYLNVLEFKNEETICLQVELEEKTSSLLIPKLTLQPVIENSIIHGFDGIKYEKEIFIRTYTSAECLIIEIRDNGNGIEINKLDLINTELDNDEGNAKSIGITNVQRRLRIHYGNEYGLRLHNLDEHGALVQIRVPCIREETLGGRALQCMML